MTSSETGAPTASPTGRKPYTFACIPAHNEEASIARVVIRARQHVDRVVVCDDGSTDMTAEIAEDLGATVLRHGCNRGYGASLATLFEYAAKNPVDAMVTLDADGQHDPRDIPRLLAPVLAEQTDVSIGSRFLGEGEIPNHRKTGIKIINRVANSGGYEGLTDTQSGFRAYNRKAIQAIRLTESGMGASTEILLKAKSSALTVTEVPIAVTYSEGRSMDMRSVRQGGSVVMNTIKHLSIERPVLFYGLPGLFFFMAGLIFGAWTIQIYLATNWFSFTQGLIAIGSILLSIMFFSIMIILLVLVSVVREGRR